MKQTEVEEGAELTDILTTKYRDSSINNPIAMYYLLLGAENYTDEVQAQIHTLLTYTWDSLGLTKEDLQEIREVDVFLYTHSDEFWEMDVEQDDLAHIGNRSLVREWVTKQ